MDTTRLSHYPALFLHVIDMRANVCKKLLNAKGLYTDMLTGSDVVREESFTNAFACVQRSMTKSFRLMLTDWALAAHVSNPCM